jgi:23S rRNA (uracil1939-C5)-methyltransferase
VRRPRPVRQALEPAEFDIHAVGGAGDGIAQGPVFIPLTLPGERVEARPDGQGRAELTQILKASSERVEPPCPHFGACGGCALQHWRHDAYLAWKVEQVRLTLSRQRLEAEFAEPFAVKPATRRRLALHARGAGRGRAVLGFKARRSWDLVPITACTIADPRLVAALPVLRDLAGALFEHPKSAPILHTTLTDTGLDIDISGVESRSGGLSADARMRIAEVAGAADFARVTLSGEVLYQERLPTVRFGKVAVGLPPGSFLQASAEAEAVMAEAACVAAAGSKGIADLFCGAGAFTFRLAEIAPVLAADSAAPAIAALKREIGSPGLKPIAAEARDLARRPVLAAELKKIDTVVFDPPRAGAVEQVGEIAASNVARVVGVSCNPATFARDASVLVAAGFKLMRVKPVDQFLWSPHIELVAVFER